MKKTLTSIYLPDKEKKNEKEGAFYKEVQQMMLERSPELDIIWSFIFESSIRKMSEAELQRMAHRPVEAGFGTASNQDSHQIPDPTLNDSSMNDLLPKVNKKLLASNFNDTTINDSSSEAFTFKVRVDESTEAGTIGGSHDMGHQFKMHNVHDPDVMEPQFSLRKHRILNTIEEDNTDRTSALVKILTAHVQVAFTLQRPTAKSNYKTPA